MGKASRSRRARQAIAEIKREEELRVAALKKKKNIINIITAAVCVVLCAVFIATVAILSTAKTNGTFLRRETAIQSDNIKFNGATFTYFLNYQYTDFVNQYSSNLASYGLDTQTDLRDQETSDGQNWFEYMAERTEANLTEILLLAEKAKSEGMALDENDKKEIDAFFEDVKKYAKESNLSEKEYIHAMYGEGVNTDDIRDGLEISMLATKYYTEKIDSVKYTDKDIDEYYNDNINDFRKVDYKYYNFVPNVTEDMTDKEMQAEYDKVEGYAKRLAAAKTPAEYDSILKTILKERDMTDTNIDTAVTNSSLTGMTYDESFDISKWAFDSKTKVNETKIYPSNNSRAVYMVTQLPHRNEGETRSVRHILIALESYETDDEAKKKAEEVLAEYNKGDKTAESFGKLAEKYTEDPGSKSTGGLYENFSEGTMVEPFEKWSFDKSRKTGDTGIVKTDYGYHVMYYVDAGEPVWKSEVTLALKDSAYSALYNELEKTYTVKLNDKILDKIPTIKITTGTDETGLEK